MKNVIIIKQRLTDLSIRETFICMLLHHIAQRFFF